MRLEKEKTIGSCTYRVRQLGPTPAIGLLLDVLHVAGPAFGKLADSIGARKGESFALKDVLDRALPADTFARVVEAFLAGADEARVQKSIKTLADATEVLKPGGGGYQKLSPIYENHFCGDASLVDLFGWLLFALEVQYSDFFGLLASRAPRAFADAGSNQAA